MTSIHPTAIIHKDACLHHTVRVGAFSVVEAGVELRAGVDIRCRCHIHSGTRLHKNVVCFDGAVLGARPQDLKYQGEETTLEIGEGTHIREYVTVSRGTAASGMARIGTNNLIMAYAHVAHDCRIGSHVIICNSVQMGGHVSIGDFSVISGMTGIHQFTVIGKGVFVGGGLRVAKDLLPFTKALGEPLTFAGVNAIAMEKYGFPGESQNFLKKLFKQMVCCPQREWRKIIEHFTSNTAEQEALKSEISCFLERSERPVLKGGVSFSDQEFGSK